ncbi:translocation/assembly module TamB [Pseudomonas sp. A-1]|uniref:translocation/assembly module TamB domain-containing protein n=1 Tax=Pseudomonas sp. A-1 TaxID=1821274 RepID=UPI0010A64B8F|nr:translocation/assembly module TamB domain-containing protein [Pseudomonas sp. A-1]THG86299.1 translocation/assembly module TamB [Pseudomonas sp. A-1]
MRRLLRRLGAAGLLLLALLAGLLALPASESGSRWLLGRVPGLALEDFRGRLLGDWSAGALRWQSGETRVAVEQLRVVNRLACLRQRLLCLDELSATRLQLELPPTEEASAEPLSLPEIRLPLGVAIQRLQLGSLEVNGVQQLHDLALAARLDAGGLQLSAVDLQRPALRLTLSELSLQPQGDWPLRARASLQLPPVDERPWQLDLQLDGRLLQRLELTARSQGYLDGELTGWLQPLAEGLPLELRLSATDFQALASLPPSLRFTTLGLTGSGTLTEGYGVSGSATLAGAEQPLSVVLRGSVDGGGAQVEQLQLQDSAGETLQLAGRLDWREAFAAELTLAGGAFAWQQLYPQPGVELELQQLQAAFSYADSRYRGDFDVRLLSPAGPLRLSSPLQGDGGQLQLPQLRLEAGKGRAQGELALTFAEAFGWQTRLQLAELDPAYWLRELPGRIGGQLASRGELRDGHLQLEADWALDGQLRQQPLALKGQLQGEDKRWQLPELALRLGDNRIDGRGVWGEKLEGQFKLALARLDQLWPGLRGQAGGELRLAGTPAAPQGSLALQGSGLGYQDHRMAGLTLDARLDARQHATVQLDARGLRSGDTDFGQLALKGSGSLQQHSVELNLDGEPLRLALALNGGLDRRQDWRGSLSRGSLAAAGFDWQLQRPASLERSAAGRITLGAHCWQSQEASLCADSQRLLPEPQLRLRLRDFDLARLRRSLPRGTALVGRVNGDLRLDLPAGGPDGELRLDAGSGQLRIRERGQWLEIPYRQLLLTSRLRPQRIDSRLLLSGPTLGALELEARIDPRPQDKPLSGSFRLEGLDLALARPFARQVERIEGRIDGGGRLSGSLLAPVVDGRVQLRDGHLSGGELPLTFEQLQLALQIDGQQARLDGSWRSGEQGQGSIAGNLGWAGAPQMDLQIRGSRLPAVVEPYASLEVEPDLQLGLRDNRLSLGGRVAVPRGRITVRELPAQAVKVSEDARVVGEQPAPSSAPDLQMDLRLAIGEDRLRFSGFGLTADLRGNLRLRDNLDSRGTLRLENGRYRAYGQRLTLRRARLIFAGPIDQPLLDIEAIREVGDVTAGLRISGRADEPLSEVFSEPAMSQEQALSYLVLGRAPGSGGDQNMVNQAALALGLAGGAPVAGAIAERLGISDFLLESEGSGTDSSMVASGYLSEKLSLRYGVGVFEPVNVFALRYQLSKKLYLEAASGLASSLDLFYKRDY